MHWVLQANLYREEKGFLALKEQLVRQEIDHTLVNLIPFAQDLDPDIDIDDNVFVCGSTSLGIVAKKKGWIPGYFDKNLDMEIVTSHYGDDMLNKEMIVSTLKDVEHKWDKFFIRPCSDKKEFSGEVMHWADFEEWRRRVIELDGTSSWTSLSGDDRVMIAPVSEIFSEYRFFVVDGKVVTGSRYKQGNRVHYSSQVDYAVNWYAHAIVDTWQPNRAFCLDIAETPEGYKVIEINSINSAGFYECDMGKFVDEISNMRFHSRNQPSE